MNFSKQESESAVVNSYEVLRKNILQAMKDIRLGNMSPEETELLKHYAWEACRELLKREEKHFSGSHTAFLKALRAKTEIGEILTFFAPSDALLENLLKEHPRVEFDSVQVQETILRENEDLLGILKQNVLARMEELLSSEGHMPPDIRELKSACIKIITNEKESFIKEFGTYDHNNFRNVLMSSPDMKKIVEFFDHQHRLKHLYAPFGILGSIPLTDEESKSARLFPSDNEIRIEDVDFTPVALNQVG